MSEPGSGQDSGQGSDAHGDAGADADAPAADNAPAAIRAASAIVLLEALALVAAAVFLVVDTALGSPDGIARALLGALFAVAGAVFLAAGARGLLRLSPGARSPVLVLQLLALPVSYSLAIEAGKVLWGGPILVAALAVIYLLFTPPAREALDRAPRA